MPFRTLTKSILLLISVWLFLVVAVATPAINLLLPRLVMQHLGHELKHGIILLDPFGMRVMAEQLSLQDKRGAQRLRIDDVEIDLGLWQSLRTRQLAVEHITVSAFTMAPAQPSAQGPGFTLAGIAVTGLRFNWQTPALAIDRISLNAPSMTADFVDGKTHIAELWQDLVPADPDTNSPAEHPQSAPLSLSLEHIDINQGEVVLFSDQFSPSRQVLDQLAFQATSIRWPEGGVPAFSLAANLAPDAQLNVSGAVFWQQDPGEINVTVSGFPLPSLQPTVDRYARAVLDSGALDLSAQLQLLGLAPEAGRGELGITSLAVHPGNASEPVTALSSLQVGPVAIDLRQQQVSIEQIAVSGARGLLHIDADGRTNFSAMLPPEAPGTAPTSTEPTSADGEAAGPPTWRLQIESTVLSDSVLDFRDDNLPVQFSAHIEDLNGQLLGFDTSSDSAAQWQAEGRIDGYAPVTLSGSIAHYSAPNDGGFSFATRGVDLARLAPYSATYAGYPIERGVMAIDLSYALKDGKLEGENHLLIERLDLGDREPSDRQVVDLPLQIAVALLSDAAGIIEIDLPVSGAVDDPQFQIWRAVGTAAMNLITNVVAAPFNFLASLVGSEAPLDRVPFGAGSVELDVVALSALDALAVALEQRPSIGIEVESHVDLQDDGQALASRALDAELSTRGLEPASLRNRDAAWQALVTTMAGESGIDPSQPEQAWQALLKARYWPAQADLDALADQRAVAIKKHLIEQGGVDAQRVAIASRGSDTFGDSSAATLGITTR